MEFVLGFDGDGDNAAAHLHEDLWNSKFFSVLLGQFRRQGIKAIFAKTVDDKGSSDDVIVLKLPVKGKTNEFAFFIADNGNVVFGFVDPRAADYEDVGATPQEAVI